MAPKRTKWRRIGAIDVPKTGFLVFGKNGLAFLGGATVRGMSPKRGFLFPEKMIWCFWGVQRRAACPQNGVSYFRKKGFGISGTWCKIAHVPFWAILICKKNIVEFNDVFSIIGVWHDVCGRFEFICDGLMPFVLRFSCASWCVERRADLHLLP